MAFFGGHRLETPGDLPTVSKDNSAYFGESGQKLGEQKNDTSGQAAANRLHGISTGLGMLAPIAAIIPGLGPAVSGGLGAVASIAGIAGSSVQNGVDTAANEKYKDQVEKYNQELHTQQETERQEYEKQQETARQEYEKHQQAAYDADQTQKAAAHYELLDAIHSVTRANENQSRPQPLEYDHTPAQTQFQSASPVARIQTEAHQIPMTSRIPMTRIKPKKPKTKVGKQKRK